MRPGGAMPAGIGTAHDAQSLKVLIVTDAWAPQVNGVVRTLEMLGRDLRALGHEVRYATPEGRFTVPMPTYPEIRLSVLPAQRAWNAKSANTRQMRSTSRPRARSASRRVRSAANTAFRSRPRSTRAFPNM